jgi:hypothetical protein
MCVHGTYRMSEKSHHIGFIVESSLFKQMFKLLATSFEAVVDTVTLTDRYEEINSTLYKQSSYQRLQAAGVRRSGDLPYLT